MALLSRTVIDFEPLDHAKGDTILVSDIFSWLHFSLWRTAQSSTHSLYPSALPARHFRRRFRRRHRARVRSLRRAHPALRLRAWPSKDQRIRRLANQPFRCVLPQGLPRPLERYRLTHLYGQTYRRAPLPARAIASAAARLGVLYWVYLAVELARLSRFCFPSDQGRPGIGPKANARIAAGAIDRD